MAEKMYCAVKALLRRGGKFLFVEYGSQPLDGVFDLPGGRIEKGEEPLGALAREVREETGFKVSVEKPVGIYWFIREGDGDQVTAFVFECSCEEAGTPFNTSEDPIKAFHWLTLQEVSQKNLGAKSTLKKLLNDYSESLR